MLIAIDIRVHRIHVAVEPLHDPPTHHEAVVVIDRLPHRDVVVARRGADLGQVGDIDVNLAHRFVVQSEARLLLARRVADERHHVPPGVGIERAPADRVAVLAIEALLIKIGVRAQLVHVEPLQSVGRDACGSLPPVVLPEVGRPAGVGVLVLIAMVRTERLNGHAAVRALLDRPFDFIVPLAQLHAVALGLHVSTEVRLGHGLFQLVEKLGEVLHRNVAWRAQVAATVPPVVAPEDHRVAEILVSVFNALDARGDIEAAGLVVHLFQRQRACFLAEVRRAAIDVQRQDRPPRAVLDPRADVVTLVQRAFASPDLV